MFCRVSVESSNGETRLLTPTEGIANSENFSLQDFFEFRGETLMDRVRPFSEHIRALNADGYALYGREVVGPTGRRVRVRDRAGTRERMMVMMGSNNYLGLANHPYVKQAVHAAIEDAGVGMGGPPLLNGMSSLHRRLEGQIAELKGKEDALLFASGFQANLGWISALLRSKDVLLYDELHHASLFDGIRIAHSTARVRTQSFRHNDVSHLSELLEKSRANLAPGAQIFVAVEGVYSMDGDLAPLPKIAGLCKAARAVLVVDDAHGTGVLGPKGGGTAEHFGIAEHVDLAMGTFSKAFGVTGGFIAGRRELVDYLRFFSKSYMFSAHLPQAMAAAVSAGVELVRTQPQLRESLHANVRAMVEGMRALGFDVKSESAIVPVILPEQVPIRELGKRFHEEGLFVNLIEYPAVPKDSQRIRLSIMADHTPADIELALDVLGRLGREFRLI
jgi:glycine C-acetyltransferase